MHRFMSVAGALAFLLSATGASAQVVEQKGLTLEAARRVIAVAVAEARRNEVGGAIAVVDAGGMWWRSSGSTAPSPRARARRWSNRKA